ncbi:uncharacterized protein PV07_07403 [Cladophialophora immunda]|uniref:Uncharacterized protein n=1 Tax=Cladophialophora immunda TaxID=569365 RepID=A0A0D2C985_9EURO|nr:uncharacterized protein PV07_07403 [Cladophialophora immunda]KIW27683.1 hypothetical protein PV07_07403 [Cladophialophora immunda]
MPSCQSVPPEMSAPCLPCGTTLLNPIKSSPENGLPQPCALTQRLCLTTTHRRHTPRLPLPQWRSLRTQSPLSFVAGSGPPGRNIRRSSAGCRGWFGIIRNTITTLLQSCISKTIAVPAASVMLLLLIGKRLGRVGYPDLVSQAVAGRCAKGACAPAS